MSKPQPFVVPEGVLFQIDDDGVTIENDGDIVLHSDFGGRALKRIVSREGNVTLHGSLRAGVIEAAAGIALHGAAKAASVRAGGEFIAQGDCDLGSAHCGGSITVIGALSCGELRAGGDITVSGPCTAAAVEAGGNLSSGGNLVADGVQAGGNVVVGGALRTGNVTGGGLTVGGEASFTTAQVSGGALFTGAVSATTIRGNTIDLRGASTQARGIQGVERVAVGPGKLTVDAILAPQVDLDARTIGRATVVESLNELGPNGLKGGFRLADYTEMFGDPASFLAERGVAPLGAPAPVAGPTVSRPEPGEESTGGAASSPALGGSAEPSSASTAEAEATPAASSAAAEEADDEVEVVEEAAPPASATAEADASAGSAADSAAAPDEVAAGPASGDPWATEPPTPAASSPSAADPSTAVTGDFGPSAATAPSPDAQGGLDEPAANGPARIAMPVAPPLAEATSMHDDDPLSGAGEHPMHAQLHSTVERVVACYDGQEIPPSVVKLRHLTVRRQYNDIRAEITNLWTELVKFHQKKGLRIQHQVTSTFNQVNGLVKKM